jgi:hypothetical protein
MNQRETYSESMADPIELPSQITGCILAITQHCIRFDGESWSKSWVQLCPVYLDRGARLCLHELKIGWNFERRRMSHRSNRNGVVLEEASCVQVLECVSNLIG